MLIFLDNKFNKEFPKKIPVGDVSQFRGNDAESFRSLRQLLRKFTAGLPCHQTRCLYQYHGATIVPF